MFLTLTFGPMYTELEFTPGTFVLSIPICAGQYVLSIPICAGQYPHTSAGQYSRFYRQYSHTSAGQYSQFYGQYSHTSAGQYSQFYGQYSHTSAGQYSRFLNTHYLGSTDVSYHVSTHRNFSTHSYVRGAHFSCSASLFPLVPSLSAGTLDLTSLPVAAIDIWWWGDETSELQIVAVALIVLASLLNCLPDNWHEYCLKLMHWKPKPEVLPARDHIMTPRERLRSTTC